VRPILIGVTAVVVALVGFAVILLVQSGGEEREPVAERRAQVVDRSDDHAEPEQSVQANVRSSDGGQVTLGDDLQVEIPPRALTKDRTVSIVRLDDKPRDVENAFPVTGPVFQIEAEQQFFDRPIEIVMEYDEEMLPDDRDEREIFAAYYYDGKWYREYGEIDPTQNTLTVRTLHASLWTWVLDYINERTIGDTAKVLNCLEQFLDPVDKPNNMPEAEAMKQEAYDDWGQAIRDADFQISELETEWREVRDRHFGKEGVREFFYDLDMEMITELGSSDALLEIGGEVVAAVSLIRKAFVLFDISLESGDAVASLVEIERAHQKIMLAKAYEYELTFPESEWMPPEYVEALLGVCVQIDKPEAVPTPAPAGEDAGTEYFNDLASTGGWNLGESLFVHRCKGAPLLTESGFGMWGSERAAYLPLPEPLVSDPGSPVSIELRYRFDCRGGIFIGLTEDDGSICASGGAWQNDGVAFTQASEDHDFVTLQWVDGGDKQSIAVETSEYQDGKWHIARMVRDGSGYWSLYVDGALLGTASKADHGHLYRFLAVQSYAGDCLAEFDYISVSSNTERIQDGAAVKQQDAQASDSTGGSETTGAPVEVPEASQPHIGDHEYVLVQCEEQGGTACPTRCADLSKRVTPEFVFVKEGMQWEGQTAKVILSGADITIYSEVADGDDLYKFRLKSTGFSVIMSPEKQEGDTIDCVVLADYEFADN
jgi:hypothetical protein